MSTLTNQQIDATYAGLIKTTDNAAITATPKALEDGLGNGIPMEIGTGGINFTAGTVDFSAATVTGLPIQPAGLTAGTGTDSMRSADSLTTTPADASGIKSIALGNAAEAVGQSAIAIGDDADSGSSSESVVIGKNVTAFSGPAFAIGRNSVINGSASVSIGNSANVQNFNSIGISGEICSVTGSRSIGMGRQATATASNAFAIGNYAKVTGNASMSFTSCAVNVNDQKAANSLMMVPGGYGCTTNAVAVNSIVLGPATSQLERASNPGAIAIGLDTQVTADNAVALGSDVIANIANTTSVTELETQAVGGGIVMYSPNGTGYKLTVSDAGAPVFTAI